MGFGGREFAFDSPAAAVAAMIARTMPGTEEAREPCDLAAARGRVLAVPIVADRDSPAFDYSAMDGYAVRLADVRGAGTGTDRVTLRVAGEVRIGTPAPVLSDGPATAIRVVTGATIPPGTDTVLKREEVTEHSSPESNTPVVAAITVTVDALHRVKTGENIRRRGENARAGSIVVDSGTVLSAAAIGTLASVGCSSPMVRRRVRVGTLTTGDELVRPEETPGEFQIRDSNSAVLRALLSSRAWLEVLGPTHVRDEEQALARHLRESIAECDAVVVTGGVSMGHRDPVRSAVESTGAQIVFHGLPQRPGKPMLGAVAKRADGASVPIFGLPGNPVSAMVTCERIVVPILSARAGVSTFSEPARVAIANPDGLSRDLWWHRLVRVDASGRAVLLEARGSGDVIAAGQSDGFVEVPPRALHTSDAAHTRYPLYRWPT